MAYELKSTCGEELHGLLKQLSNAHEKFNKLVILNPMVQSRVRVRTSISSTELEFPTLILTTHLSGLASHGIKRAS